MRNTSNPWTQHVQRSTLKDKIRFTDPDQVSKVTFWKMNLGKLTMATWLYRPPGPPRIPIPGTRRLADLRDKVLFFHWIVSSPFAPWHLPGRWIHGEKWLGPFEPSCPESEPPMSKASCPPSSLPGVKFDFVDQSMHKKSSPHPKKHSSQRKLLGFQHSSLCSWTLAMWNECCWERDHWPLSPKDFVWKIGSPGLSCVPCCLDDPLQDQNDLKLGLGKVLRTNLPQWAVFVNPERFLISLTIILVGLSVAILNESIYSISLGLILGWSINITCDWWWAAIEGVQCPSLHQAGCQRSTPLGDSGSALPPPLSP